MTKSTTAHPRNLISDQAWAAILPSLPKWTERATARSFLEAVAFRARAGCPWRDLPERFGHWHKTYARFANWSKKGWLADLHAAALDHAGVDISQASLDSTASKLHKSAHGPEKKDRPSASPKVDGRPRSTPSPTAPAKRSDFVLSPGNRQDMPFAEAAIGKWRPAMLLAHRGYDSEPFRRWLRNKRVRPVIRGKKNRIKKIRHDKAAYKERNVVERLFGRMKEWSCLAMRREKNDESFFSLLSLFATLDILKNTV